MNRVDQLRNLKDRIESEYEHDYSGARGAANALDRAIEIVAAHESQQNMRIGALENRVSTLQKLVLPCHCPDCKGTGLSHRADEWFPWPCETCGGWDAYPHSTGWKSRVVDTLVRQTICRALGKLPPAPSIGETRNILHWCVGDSEPRVFGAYGDKWLCPFEHGEHDLSEQEDGSVWCYVEPQTWPKKKVANGIHEQPKRESGLPALSAVGYDHDAPIRKVSECPRCVVGIVTTEPNGKQWCSTCVGAK